MTLAFKEWAYIVDALGQGLQSIILRKGGIEEEGGEFKLKGKRFLLLPTQFHQHQDMIKPDWLPKLNPAHYQLSQDKVKIEFYAEIVADQIIKEWAILEKLENEHAWKREIIAERFNRWEKSAHLLILQVYKLNTPFELEMLPQYGGCKSWIELEEDIDFEGKPILNKNIKGTFWA